MPAVYILARLANTGSAGPLTVGFSTCYARHMETALLVVSGISALAALVGAVSGVWAAITASRNSKSITHLTGRVENLTGRVDNLTGRVESLTGRVDNLTGRVDALQVIFAANIKQPQQS